MRHLSSTIVPRTLWNTIVSSLAIAFLLCWGQVSSGQTLHQEQRRITAGADVVVSNGGESADDETMSVPNPRDRRDLMGGSMVAVATTRLAAASPIVPLLVHQMYIIIVFAAFSILVSGMLVVLFVTGALFFLAKGEPGVAPSCSSGTYRHHVAN